MAGRRKEGKESEALCGPKSSLKIKTQLLLSATPETRKS